MMKYDNDLAIRVENAVIEVFGFDRSDLSRFVDTDLKKIVVAILFGRYDFNWRSLGVVYKMTYLYVPTVFEQFSIKCENDVCFKSKIDRVIEIVEKNETLLEAV